MTTQALEKSNGKKSIQAYLEGPQFHQAVQAALPRHLKPERFIRIALTALTRTPKLAQCDQASFFQSLLTLSQLGLEPDGRRAHLIPYENRKRGVVECQLIVDYKGLAELVMRSGIVSNLHADVVCENDEFEYDRGQLVKHKVNFREPRGKVYAAYALCRLKDGSEKVEVMSRDEVEGIRSRSRAANAGPWQTDWNEMAKKTVFRRLSKWLPLSPEIRDAVEADDEIETNRIAAAKPVYDATAMFGETEDPKAIAERNARWVGETPEPQPEKETKSIQHQLADYMLEQGVAFDDFRSFLAAEGHVKDADSLSCWDEIPAAVCEKFQGDAKLLAKVVKIYGGAK